MVNAAGNGFVINPGRLLNSGTLRRRLISNGRPDPHNYGFSAQAHHLIPDAIMRDIPELSNAYENGLFDFDGVDNGVFLPDSVDAANLARTGTPPWPGPTTVHGPGTNHPRYSQRVREIATQKFLDLGPNPTDAQIKTAIKEIADEAKTLLTIEPYVVDGVLK